MPTVLFYRDFRWFHGGHLKVWDYFNHVRATPGFEARISFSDRTAWDETNPWLAMRSEALHGPDALRPDILFLDGLDWLALKEDERRRPKVPIINLVQHVRHASPGDPRYRFLGHPAIRICVSLAVADALLASRAANGPIFTIPAGLGSLPAPAGDEEPRAIDVLIAALKQPELGRRLHAALASPGRRVELLCSRLPRGRYLEVVRKARVGVFLPHVEEGFYLPGLEGMALGTTVVCPECVGTLSYCFDGHNGFRPAHSFDAILEAAHRALALSSEARRALGANARATAARHDLARERDAFAGILLQAHELWRRSA